MTVDEVKILLSDLNRGYNTPYSSAEPGDYRKTLLRGLGKAFERLSMSRQVARRRARNQLVHQKTRKNEREIELQTACRGYSANRRVFGNLHERQSDRRGGRGVPQRAPERRPGVSRLSLRRKRMPKHRKLAGNHRNSKRHTTVSPSSNPRKWNLKAVAPHCRPESTPRRPPKRRPLTTRSPAAMTPEPKALTKPTSGRREQRQYCR